jgi:hypothetical protein
VETLIEEPLSRFWKIVLVSNHALVFTMILARDISWSSSCSVGMKGILVSTFPEIDLSQSSVILPVIPFSLTCFVLPLHLRKSS